MQLESIQEQKVPELPVQSHFWGFLPHTFACSLEELLAIKVAYDSAQVILGTSSVQDLVFALQ